jgi:hypothetical protein
MNLPSDLKNLYEQMEFFYDELQYEEDMPKQEIKKFKKALDIVEELKLKYFPE